MLASRFAFGWPFLQGGAFERSAKEGFAISSGNRSSVSLSHLLFLVGGLLLGYAIAVLAIVDDPNVTQVGAGVVVGLCTLIVGQQSAARSDGRASED